MRRQQGGFATAALVAKYGVPFVKKRVLPYLMKKYIASQAGGVFKGKNRQRGNKKKKQRGGFFGPSIGEYMANPYKLFAPNFTKYALQSGSGKRRRVQRGGRKADLFGLLSALGKDAFRLTKSGSSPFVDGLYT